MPHTIVYLHNQHARLHMHTIAEVTRHNRME